MEQSFKEMLQVLKRNKSRGPIALKAEFEAEGTRMSEFLILKEISALIGMPLVLKIGGCEAIRDLIECRDLFVQNIVAPMIETSYAASKFAGAINRVYIDLEKPNLYINIETITAYNNLDQILSVIKGTINGIILGRVDYVGSLSLSRNDVNSDLVLEHAKRISKKALDSNLELVVGGGVSIESIPFLRELSLVNLSRFETRKCVFTSDILDNKDELKQALKDSVLFELLWLKYKRKRNRVISQEDESRISMLEKRHLYNLTANA